MYRIVRVEVGQLFVGPLEKIGVLTCKIVPIKGRVLYDSFGRQEPERLRDGGVVLVRVTCFDRDAFEAVLEASDRLKGPMRAGEPRPVPDRTQIGLRSHGDIETVWVIESIDRVAHTSAYARITAGYHAGTVRVRCDDQPDGRCLVTVNYDMTALSSDRPEVLDGYDETSFAAMMTDWGNGVTAAL